MSMTAEDLRRLRTPLTMSINQFAKTIEGEAIVLQQVPFCLGGLCYQGFNGSVFSCDPGQLTSKEVEEILDIDGTAPQLKAVRKQRDEARRIAKDNEHRKNIDAKVAVENNKIQLEVARLQLQKLQQENGLSSPPAPVEEQPMTAEPEPEPEYREYQFEKPEEADPAPDLGLFPCPKCDKVYTSERELRGHKTGARHHE